MSLQARAAALGLTSVVLFLGRLPQDQLPGALAAADIVVLPSRNEGLPRCLVEALAMQRPVVATRISGNTEVVQDGETGFLVDPAPEPIRQGLAKMLRLSPEARSEMGRREQVCDRFGLDPVATRMIEELMQSPLRGPANA